MTRELLRKQLIADEGVKLCAYQDSLGFWTIGIGRLIDARKGGGITRAEADYLLNNDIDRVIRELAIAIPWMVDLDPVRQAVLVMLGFQLGVGSAVAGTGLLGFRGMLKALRAGDYETAAVCLLDSKLGREDAPKRTRRNAEILRSGEWPS